LEPGDTVLILLNESDYFDVLRRRFVGRAKPYLERYHGSFVFRPPSIGPLERWSDWSLLVRVAARVFDRSSSEPASESLDPSQSIEIIDFILSRIREETPEGVGVILAHQGTRNFLGPKFSLSSTVFCQFAHVCIDLDDDGRSCSSSSRWSLECVGPCGSGASSLEGASPLTLWDGRMRRGRRSPAARAPTNLLLIVISNGGSVTGDELKLGRHVRPRRLAHLKHAAPIPCLAPEPRQVPSDFHTSLRTDRVFPLS